MMHVKKITPKKKKKKNRKKNHLQVSKNKFHK
jgi:hypothetical protein